MKFSVLTKVPSHFYILIVYAFPLAVIFTAYPLPNFLRSLLQLMVIVPLATGKVLSGVLASLVGINAFQSVINNCPYVKSPT